jgi:hypothetical protein
MPVVIQFRGRKEGGKFVARVVVGELACPVLGRNAVSDGRRASSKIASG